MIAYASFRSTIPPPANSRFGRVQGENMQAACVNPAALGGGSGALHAYLSSGGRSIVGSAAEPRAVGDAAEGDRHAVCQRARPADRAVRRE